MAESLRVILVNNGTAVDDGGSIDDGDGPPELDWEEEMSSSATAASDAECEIELPISNYRLQPAVLVAAAVAAVHEPRLRFVGRRRGACDRQALDNYVALAVAPYPDYRAELEHFRTTEAVILLCEASAGDVNDAVWAAAVMVAEIRRTAVRVAKAVQHIDNAVSAFSRWDLTVPIVDPSENRPADLTAAAATFDNVLGVAVRHTTPDICFKLHPVPRYNHIDGFDRCTTHATRAALENYVQKHIYWYFSVINWPARFTAWLQRQMGFAPPLLPPRASATARSPRGPPLRPELVERVVERRRRHAQDVASRRPRRQRW